MMFRSVVPVLACACLVLGLSAGARAADNVHATGFGSGGIAMGTWRWLNDVEGTGYISWVFDNSAIRTDDMAVHFQGLAAFPPGHSGTLTLRAHYGFPGTALVLGPHAEIPLTLTATSDPAVVGVAVEGDLAISAAMMDAVAPDARRLSIRIVQSENPGVSVAFRQMDATLSTTAPGSGTGGDGDSGDSGGDGGAGESGDSDDGAADDDDACDDGRDTFGSDADGCDTDDGGTTNGGTAGDGDTGGDTTNGGTTSDGGTDGTSDGTTDGGGSNGGGGAGLVIEVTDGGRTLTTNVPFLLAQPGGDFDPDEDGVLQEFEDLAMNQLNPLVELDENEGWRYDRDVDNSVNFVKVTPYPDVWTPRYLLVMYATAWARDYGRATIPGFDWWNETIAIKHNGDIEKVVLAFEVKSPTRAELAYVYTSAHADPTLHSGVWSASGTSCNKGQVKFGFDQTICSALEFEDNRVKVQASQDKHAYYPTADACEDVLLVMRLGTGVGEDCAGGGTETFPAYNVGEKGHYLMDDIGWLFPGEAITGSSWKPGEGFCGGDTSTYFSAMPCVGSIAGALDGPPGLLAPVLKAAPLELPYGTAQMYEHDNFQGLPLGLSAGEEMANLSRMSVAGTIMNDTISSLKLGRGVSCRFYEHANFAGRVLGPVTADDAPDGEWPSLSQQGFNDQISSVRCVPEN